MISLGSDAATIVVSVVVVGALTGFAFLSVEAAARPPGWSRRAMRSVAMGAGVLIALGALLLIWVRPVWVGVASVYVGAIVWVMARSVRASLRRADALGGAEISEGRRRLLLLTTAHWMWWLAAGLVAAAIVDGFWRGLHALATLALAGAFAVAAMRAGGHADRLG